jgi:hypothetical protein
LRIEDQRLKMDAATDPPSAIFYPPSSILYPLSAILVLCGLLAGCAGSSNFASDPLLGGPPAPRPTGLAPAAPAGQSQTAVPPLSAPHASSSTASLATGTFPPLDPRPDLRTAGPAGTWKGSATPVGATLQAPELAGAAFPRRESSPPAGIALTGTTRPVTPTNARPLTYEQAQALLSARGVTWQRLEAGTEPGEWHFSCSVPNRQNPHIRRVYEARAGHAIAAMQAVLEQMDREQ